MNLFLCQSFLTISECANIVSTKANFTSPQASKPMLAIKQDAMTGGFVLTDGFITISKGVFLSVLSMPYFNFDFIFNKSSHIYNVLDALHLLDDHELSKQDMFNQRYYTGHSLFSFLLPDDFEYFCDNGIGNQPILIHQGVLIQGTLDKQALGSASASLIHHLFKDYGPDRAAEFVTRYQILINCWFQHHGFSVGLEDCIPENSEAVEEVINKCFLKGAAIIQTEKNAEVLESKISFALNQAVNEGQKLAHHALKKDNSIVRIVRSGAKGNFINVAQVTGLVGQQNVSAARISKSYGGRTLPHFRFDDTLRDPSDIQELDTLFVSRGFVKSSFFKGLNVYEFFFHAAGGREGLIDTAVKTGILFFSLILT